MNTGNDATVWQDPSLVQRFLSGVRSAIPFARQQLQIMMQILGSGREIETLLDVGCGDGLLIDTVLQQYAQAHAVGVDFSPAMLESAKLRLADRATLLERNFSRPGWERGLGRFDAIVSGFAIHHQPDDRKKYIYRELYDILEPNGWFVHIEHVSSVSEVGKKLWEQQMTDALFAYHHNRDNSVTREQVYKQFIDRQDRDANILTSLERQLHWMREIGYVHVDCYFKSYELCVFAGMRPIYEKS